MLVLLPLDVALDIELVIDVLDESNHLFMLLRPAQTNPPAAAPPIIRPVFWMGGKEDLDIPLATAPPTPATAPANPILLPIPLPIALALSLSKETCPCKCMLFSLLLLLLIQNIISELSKLILMYKNKTRNK